MGQMIKVDSASHWYFPNGEPCHQVEMASKPGEFRNTSLGDARKFGLLPSVTNVLSMLAKPGLDKWKKEQLALGFLTMTDAEKAGKTPEEICQLADMRGREEVEVARVFGSTLHNSIETYIVSGELPQDPKIVPFFERFETWWHREVEEVYLTERTVVGEGYAGRLDLKARIKGIGVVIGDFKTRKRSSPTKSQEKKGLPGNFATYEEDGMQLAAYKMAESGFVDFLNPVGNGPDAEGCVSIFINSQEPEEPHIHVWDKEDLDRYWLAFESLKNAWAHLKNYQPSEFVS